VEDAAPTSQEIQQQLAKLQGVIVADKQLYDKCKGYGSVEVWGPVSKVIIAHANFYRGEILRAKHNLARYMRGDEPVEQKKFVWFWVNDVQHAVESVYDSVEQNDAAYARLEKLPRENPKYELAQSMFNLADSTLEANKNYLKDLTETLTRYTYGG